MNLVKINEQSEITQDLFARVESAAEMFSGAVSVEDARADHGTFAVWVDFGEGEEDIVATGEAPSEALEAALAVLEGWANKGSITLGS